MLRMFAYLSPMGWPCIYSGCFTCWMVIRILSHWMGYFLDIGFDYGYRKCSLFGITFLPYWGDPHDELLYRELSFFSCW